MIKKILCISFVLIAFGLLLSHELIPHHHHAVSDSSNHGHEHDGEEHSHNILKCFFSLLHHSDFDNLVLINSSVNNELVKSKLSSLDLPFPCNNQIGLVPVLNYTWQNIHIDFNKNLFSSLTFRGPPIA